MLVILPSSKRGEIKISMILPYIPRDIIKVIISTIATNIAFFIISFIYLFFGFEKARDLYLSKLRFEKIAKILGLKELIIIFFEDKQRFKFIFDCNTLDLIHLLLEAERDVLKLSKALIKEDSVIIDVGAYRGGYTIRFAKKAIKGKVIAIEPNSENYKFLLLNIYYNDVKNVIVYKTIAYSHRTKIKFFENKDVPAMSRIVTDNSNNIVIEAITLDEITKSNGLKKIDLIKIDAEGSEYEILKGSEYTLKLTKYLIIEVSKDLKQIFDLLEERRFIVINLGDFYRLGLFYICAINRRFLL
jgi:FkbM family methyltransferase